MPRPHEFPTKVKVAAYKRCEGHCEKCTAPLATGKFRYDHRIPVTLGGESTLANCQVLCTSCDAPKTYGEDIPAIARAKRREAHHIGAKAPSKNPLPGGRNSKFKIKIDRTMVPR